MVVLVLGVGVGLVWRQLHGSGIVVSTKKRETKATGGARALARNDPSHRPF